MPFPWAESAFTMDNAVFVDGSNAFGPPNKKGKMPGPLIDTLFYTTPVSSMIRATPI